ncbi:Protein ILITYHIA [Camellia lanceoleosa]|nr:Protein ILITYHIA [Camellia lanceoleosa]
MVAASIFNSAEMSSELVLVLVDMIFKTLCIYDDRGSRKAVDDVITKALGEVTFMKSFAATVVQDAWIPYKDSPELLGLLLEFSSLIPSLFDQWKVLYFNCRFFISSLKGIVRVQEISQTAEMDV